MIILIFFLVVMPLLAMPAWMAYNKKQHHRPYLLYWLATLLPVIAFVLMMAVNPNLASHAFIQILITLPAVMGATAFLGGLVYLLKCIFSDVIASNKKVFNMRITTTKNQYAINMETNTDIWGRKFWRNDDFYGKEFWENNDFWGR